MSEHIGNFIKDPNLIDTNVLQLVEETVNSKVGELAGKVKVFEEFYQQESRTRDSTMIKAREMVRLHDAEMTGQNQRLSWVEEKLKEPYRNLQRDAV